MTPSLTHEEKREIAVGIYRGEIFTSAHVPKHDQHFIPDIFLCLHLLDEASLAELKQRDIGVLWEYRAKASPTGFNGYPVFLSLNSMTVGDWRDVSRMVAVLQASEATL